MSSPWHTLVSQKLFLARTLVQLQQRCEHASEREATCQGAIELGLRSRQLMLTMIADLYQHRKVYPATLEQLTSLIGDAMPEVEELRGLADSSDSWWSHLAQLEQAQANPPARKKTVSEDNIIAVSVDTGPDRSAPALERTFSAMKMFADSLMERHGEW